MAAPFSWLENDPDNMSAIKPDPKRDATVLFDCVEELLAIRFVGFGRGWLPF